MSRPCTIGDYPRFRSLGAYAVDTADYFGDASDLNAAPPPPPKPKPAGPSLPMVALVAAGAYWLWRHN